MCRYMGIANMVMKGLVAHSSPLVACGLKIYCSSALSNTPSSTPSSALSSTLLVITIAVIATNTEEGSISDEVLRNSISLLLDLLLD
jgi:hypothetical protein